MYINLIAEMSRYRITKTDLSKALGITMKTLQIKMENDKFYIKEMRYIKLYIEQIKKEKFKDNKKINFEYLCEFYTE